MKRWIPAVAVLAVAFVRGGTASAAEPAVAQVRTVVAVDGAPCGYIMNVSGADMRLPPTPGAAPATYAVICAPLSFEVALPVAEPLARLITGLCSGTTTGSRLAVSDVTGTGTTAVRTLEYGNAVLTEVRLPSGKQGATTSRITLVFQGTSSRITDTVTPIALPPAPGSAQGLSHAVLEGTRAAPLRPLARGITIKRGVAMAAVGPDRFKTTLSPGPLEVSPLVFELRADQCGELNTWRDEAVHAGSPLATEGTLTYYAGVSGPVGSKPVLILHLTGVGMSKVEAVPFDVQGPRKMSIELSVQGACIEFPAPPPPTAGVRRGA